jgi:hypothetical protein
MSHLLQTNRNNESAKKYNINASLNSNNNENYHNDEAFQDFNIKMHSVEES